MSSSPESTPNWTEHHALTFPTQRPNEHVILLLRRHWIILVRDVIQLLIALVIPPIVITGVLLYTTFELTPGTISWIFAVELISLYYLFCLLTFFHDFVDYHLDIWVLTDQRIVSIEQTGLFQRVISEVNITRVQDVTSEVKGSVQTILGYGHVYIQTAGQQERFVFEQVAHPSEVARVILQAHDRALHSEQVQLMHEEAAIQHARGLAGPKPQPSHMPSAFTAPDTEKPQDPQSIG